MPQTKSVTRKNNMVADYYQKTVIMPTYLLAFIVCDFDYIEDRAGQQNKTSVSMFFLMSFVKYLSHCSYAA
jgi:aminopeptidase N